ncbi:hypothetical protein Rfer_4462 (plasmid) [Rhodoferax ferrireducens T118]|uniref:Uncharacterized protein n=1 Tax=Albidiferax ferrireducens (strain ATCC BAA-621 / DSM 15236 / T118) TaxID=338969 RepID=Q21PZ7_ALBFT|nr:hypothetical protein [Rhodoferax ferrireducens]ABD72148.1 hypothetical protein Rfer_4462 [Rhodoferax ferrireducens T118]
MFFDKTIDSTIYIFGIGRLYFLVGFLADGDVYGRMTIRPKNHENEWAHTWADAMSLDAFEAWAPTAPTRILKELEAEIYVSLDGRDYPFRHPKGRLTAKAAIIDRVLEHRVV